MSEKQNTEFSGDGFWSIQVERAVLAACMRPDGCLADCFERGVSVDEFYRSGHRLIWGSVLACHGRGLEVDEITVEEQLAASGNLEAAGGRSEINEISGAVSNVAFAGSWLSQLIDLSKRRRAQRAAGKLREAVDDPAESFEEVQKRMGPILTELSGLSLEEHSETTADAARYAREQAAAWVAGDESKIDRSREIVFGIPSFDSAFAALNPLDSDFLIGIGGESSHGKSALARQIAVNNLYRGKRVVVFLLETSRVMWFKQAASQRAQLNLRSDMSEVSLTAKGPERQQKFLREMETYEKWADDELLFIDESSVTAEDIIAKTLQIRERTGSVDMIVVDYLQEMQSSDKKLRSDEKHHENCKALKRLAKQCRCPLFLVSSINPGYDKKYGPGKWDYRGSRDITYEFDQAFMIWRPLEFIAGKQKGNPQNEMLDDDTPRRQFQQVLNRVKGRDSQTGGAIITFQPEFTLFWGLPADGKKGRKPHDPEFESAEVF